MIKIIVFSAIMFLSYILTVSTISTAVVALTKKGYIDRGWKARLALYIVIIILVVIYKFVL